MNKPALEAAREQLRYWQAECDAARRAENMERIALCERSIRQCEVVISALERMAKGRE
jgi:hypothetical protein